MAKTVKDTVQTQAPEAPSSETDLVKAADVNEQASDTLAAVQTALSLNTSGFSDEESRTLKKASVARYREFAPADATERVFATLSVGLQNAVMTSLEHAAGADMLDVRSEEFRNAPRAKGVASYGRLTDTVTRKQSVVNSNRRNRRSAIVGNDPSRRNASRETENLNDPARKEQRTRWTQGWFCNISGRRFHAGESALWRADSLGHALPLARSGRQETVPYARRSKGLGRAARQHQCA
jgi:hypothetical protein